MTIYTHVVDRLTMGEEYFILNNPHGLRMLMDHEKRKA